MIDWVDHSLKSWAEQYDGGSYGAGRGVNVIAALIKSNGVLIPSTAPYYGMDADAQQMDIYVDRLTPKLRDAVIVFYRVKVNEGVDVQARLLGCSRATLYRRIDKAHELIRGFYRVVRDTRIERVS